MGQQAHITVWLLLGLIVVVVGIPSVGQAQTTTQVSVGLGEAEPNSPSLNPALSADGRFVAFESEASNLVAGVDGRRESDIFVYDRQTGITTRVSVAPGGGEPSNDSINPALSADGRVVAYQSAATNPTVGKGWTDDIFVYDRQTGTTNRVSVALGGGRP